MTRNELFPNWVTANVMLNELIERYWGFSLSQEGMNGIRISFVDGEILDFIPPEDRDTFVDIYNKFVRWAYKELNIENIWAKYEGVSNTEQNRIDLKNEIVREIERFDYYYRGLKGKLKDMLGLPKPTLNVTFEINIDI